jgi:hypothetical protein
MASEPLLCPSCARTYPLEERFCKSCGMPLTYVGRDGMRAPPTDRQRRLRKIKPQYSEGELVRVAGGRHRAEAEFIQGLLLEEGVPSLLRRSPGFDVPDFLAAGPRDVFVPESGVSVARDVLLESELAPQTGARPDSPARVLMVLLAFLAVAALLAWVVTAVT